MTQVSSQEEFVAALNALESEIVVIANIIVNSTLAISYTTSVSSNTAAPYTLTKADDFDGAIFSLTAVDSALTVQNLILDGAKQSHTSTGTPSALITANYGSLVLGSGAVLQNNIGYNGGGISAINSIATPSSITVRGDAAIRENVAIVNGGGIYFSAYQGGVNIDEQATVSNNKAVLGGGIYFEDNSARSLSVLNIGGNAQISANSATSGGGIDVAVGELLINDNAEISENTAERYGGGIANYGNTVTIADDVKILNNTAQNGGGIYFSSATATSVSIHGLIQGNSAFTAGGVYINGMQQGELNLSRAQFIQNRTTSYDHAGGLAIYSNSSSDTSLSVTMEGTVFDGNRTGGRGSGLYINYELSAIINLIMDGCRIENNSGAEDGGGMHIRASGNSTILIQNSTISNNSGNYGGGAYIIHNNVDQANLIIRNVTFNSNNSGIGAGLYIDSGNIAALLSGVTITNNTSSQSGGGLEIAPALGSVVIVNNSSFIGNSSGYGGGINNDNSNRTLTLTDVNMEQNSAVYGKDVFNNGILNIGPNVIMSEGLNINRESALPTIIHNLSAQSAIQLEENYFITSNPQGRAIPIANSTVTVTPQDAAVFRVPTGMVGWQSQPNDALNGVVLAPEKYEITYQNTRGAYNPNPTNYTVVSSTITLTNLSDIPDYRFLGWFDEPNGGNRITEISQGSTGNRTFYAQWQSLSHTIAYYGNDAGGTPAEDIPLPQTVPDGDNIILSDGSPTRTGYIFREWNTTSDGTGSAYLPGAELTNVVDNVNLYAQWVLLPPTEHVLAYHPNDSAESPAHGMPSNTAVIDGDTAYISALVPTRLGFVFREWNTTSDGSGTAYYPDDTIPNVRGNIDLHAQWIALPIYTVTYYGNDSAQSPAQDVPDSVSAYEGDSITVADNAPTRVGYRFKVWNTLPNGTGANYSPGSTLGPIASNVQLYAQWQRDQESFYDVRFIDNAYCGCKQCDTRTMRVYFDETARIPYRVPCRHCHCFIGWNTHPDGCGTYYKPGQTLGINGNINLYAQWRRC